MEEFKVGDVVEWLMPSDLYAAPSHSFSFGVVVKVKQGPLERDLRVRWILKNGRSFSINVPPHEVVAVAAERAEMIRLGFPEYFEELGV